MTRPPHDADRRTGRATPPVPTRPPVRPTAPAGPPGGADRNGRLGRTSLRPVVWSLCVTQIVSWGVLFYAFPVLASDIAAAEDWPLTTLVGIFSAAQVLSSVLGVWVGRHIDRHGPRAVMTLGSVLAVAAILCVASAGSLMAFAAAWAAVGAAMSATLYPPAFAAMTHWARPEHRVRALTTITLVAGFASTVFAPLAALLVEWTDWRTTYLLLTIPLATTVVLHAAGLRAPWPEPEQVQARRPHTRRRHRRRRADAVVAQPAFLALVAAFTLGGFAIYAVVVNLVPLLTENGIDTTDAALALGIGGAGQVAGRLLYAPLHARLAAAGRTSATLAMAAVSTAALAVVSHPLVVVYALSFTAGAARGVFTLVQATAISDRWGTHAYGARNGLLSGAVTAAAAIAPFAGALLAATLGGYAPAFGVLAGLAATAAILARMLRQS